MAARFARFTVCSVDAGDASDPADWTAAGELVGIVDEKAGGIVAYCHQSYAETLLSALGDDLPYLADVSSAECLDAGLSCSIDPRAGRCTECGQAEVS